MKILNISRFIVPFLTLALASFSPLKGHCVQKKEDRESLEKAIILGQEAFSSLGRLDTSSDKENCPKDKQDKKNAFRPKLDLTGFFNKKELTQQQSQEMVKIFQFTQNDPIWRTQQFPGSLPLKKAVGFQEALYLMNEVLKDFPGLQQTGHGSILYHGSTSASLLAFTPYSGSDQGKLIPTGQLLSSGRVPFSGALDGIAEKGEGTGVNNDNLSTVFVSELATALGYADAEFNEERNKWEFSPKKSKTPEWLELMENGENPTTLGWSNSMVERVYEKRLKDWTTLKKEEQDLVRNPFPVLYGLRPSQESSYGNTSHSDVNMEILLKNGLSSEGIKVIFVPQENLPQVKELMKKYYPQFSFALESIESLLSPIKTEALPQ